MKAHHLPSLAAAVVAATAVINGINVAALASCQTVRPTEMTVAEHHAEAQKERDKASADRDHYDPSATRLEVTSPPSSNDAPSLQEYNPTARYLAEAARHEAHAKAHERAADKLAHFEDDACKPFAPAVRTACPVLGSVKHVEHLADGARVDLVNPAEAEAVAQHIRCHVAFADAHGESTVEGCPLYIKGLTVKVQNGSLVFHVKSGDVDRLNQMLLEHSSP